MKFLHISDLHIGKIIFEQSLLEDQQYILNQIIEIAKKEKINALLISGDVYDRTVPPASAIDIFDDFLNRIILDLKIKVFIISGNHDSKERLGFGNKLLEKEGLFIQTMYTGNVFKYHFEDDKVNVYLLPFIRPADVQDYFTDKIDSYDEAIRNVIKNEKLNKKETNIILAHQFVIPKTGSIERSDSETMCLGGTEEVGADIFKNFDYTALGHIHRPQSLGEDNIRYSGSILKYSFSESRDEKSAIIFDTLAKSITKIPLIPKKDLRVIEGKLEELVKEEVVSLADREDYIKAILTNDEPIYDAIGALRRAYPNVLNVEFKRGKATNQNYNDVDLEKIKKLDSLELFENFYNEQNNVKMSEECENLIKDIIKNVKEEIQD